MESSQQCFLIQILRFFLFLYYYLFFTFLQTRQKEYQEKRPVNHYFDGATSV